MRLDSRQDRSLLLRKAIMILIAHRYIQVIRLLDKQIFKSLSTVSPSFFNQDSNPRSHLAKL